MVSRLCGRQPLYAKPLWKVIYTHGQWDKYSVDLNNIEVDKLNHRALVYVLIGNSNHCSYICDLIRGLYPDVMHTIVIGAGENTGSGIISGSRL